MRYFSINGHICGRIWEGQHCDKHVERRVTRRAGGTKLRKLLEGLLKDGDFQSAKFDPATTIAFISVKSTGRVLVERSRLYSLSEFPSLADLLEEA